MRAVIEPSLRQAAHRMAASLRTEQTYDVLHLLDCGEEGLALDTLCSHLYEDGVRIDEGTRQLIARR